MKTQILTKVLVTTTFVGALFSNLVYAGTSEKNPFNDTALKSHPVQVSQDAEKNVFLQEALNKISMQSGISFKVNTDIAKIKVMSPTANHDWIATIHSILEGYNWVGIQEGKALKTVIIIGKTGDDLVPDRTELDAQAVDNQTDFSQEENINYWQNVQYVGIEAIE